MPHQCTDCGTTFADGSTEMLSGCPDCGGNTFQFLPEGTAGEAESAAGTGSDPTPETASKPDSTPESDVDRPKHPSPGDSVARTVGNAAKTVRDIVGADSSGPGTSPEAADPLEPWPEDSARSKDGNMAETAPSSNPDSPSADRDRRSQRPDGEDVAQASARSAVVTPEELPESGTAELAAGGPSAPSQSPEPESSVGEHQAEPTESEQTDRPDLEELREELNDQFESIRIVEPGQYELNLMELYDREEYIIALQEDGRYQIQVPESW